LVIAILAHLYYSRRWAFHLERFFRLP
jgi:hypothetical protein